MVRKINDLQLRCSTIFETARLEGIFRETMALKPFISLFIALGALIFMPFSSMAQQPIIPDVAVHEKSDYEKRCKSVSFGEDFIVHLDFNNDKLDDIIVNGGAVTCDGVEGPDCKPVGCPYKFYLQVEEGGYLMAANADLFGYDLAKRYGNMVLVLKAHGASCQRAAPDFCLITVRVRGTDFDIISKK